jgi:hypothetical protein
MFRVILIATDARNLDVEQGTGGDVQAAVHRRPRRRNLSRPSLLTTAYNATATFLARASTPARKEATLRDAEPAPT